MQREAEAAAASKQQRQAVEAASSGCGKARRLNNVTRDGQITCSHLIQVFGSFVLRRTEKCDVTTMG